MQPWRLSRSDYLKAVAVRRHGQHAGLGGVQAAFDDALFGDLSIGGLIDFSYVLAASKTIREFQDGADQDGERHTLAGADQDGERHTLAAQV